VITRLLFAWLLDRWDCRRGRHREEVVAVDLFEAVDRRTGAWRRAGWQTLRCECCGAVRRELMWHAVEIPVLEVPALWQPVGGAA
jgi:hypothetical protein